jgi:DNA-binding response OmpR family regulator
VSSATHTAFPDTPRILLVDDEEEVLHAFGALLDRSGYLVDQARALGEAFRLLSDASYALVITDLCFDAGRGVEGYELIDFVRSHSPYTRTLLLTGHASTEVEDRARRHGADRVLDKAGHPNTVVAAVAELLGQSGGKS